jgi:multidrug efflux system membrane fusion protein
MQEQPPVRPADEPPEYFESPPQDQPRRLSRRAKAIGAVVAVLLLAGLGWLGWSLTHEDTSSASARGPGGGGGPGGPGGPGGFGGGGGRGPATTVGIAVAQAADIPVSLDALGTVSPRATVRVRPQVSGVLKEIRFKEGQQVKAGELLALIDPRPFEMALQQSVGQRMRDEAQLEAAKVTLTRYRTLLSQDSIARQDVDTQAAQVRQLEAAVVSDKANEGTARLNLAYTRVTAPVAGRVGLRNVDVGNTVGPSDTNGIAVITQLTPIDVEFAIPQDHAAWLQHNSGAFMEVKAFDRTRTELLDTGVFSSLDNQIDTQTGTVRAKARFNNARLQLFPSQFVNVQLQIRTVKDAVVVPVTAVRQGGNGDYVFVLQEDRTVKLRPVVRGQLLGDRIQVASGLQIGERVVTEGADRLRDGSRVVLPGDTAGGQGWSGRRRGAASGASAPASGASAAQAPAGEGQGRGRRGDTAGASNPFAGASQVTGAGAPKPAERPVAQTPNPNAANPTPAPAAATSKGPTPEQRQRMLDAAKDNPEQLERRKKFLEALDRGDPQAIERWQMMQQRRREGGGGPRQE